MSIPADIPFLDLITPHVELEDELTAVFQQALRTAGFIGGAMVEEFEKGFAGFCTTKYAVAVNSGTDALRFAMIAAGIRSGDVVVTVPNPFIATTEAISQAGGLPEFVDIDERTYNMDPGKLRQYLEQKCTRDTLGNLISGRSGRPVTAVVPVHLYGQMADMDAILELAEKFGLVVVEDACQAHGAQYFSSNHNQRFTAGSIGKAAAFSFYPGKNLGACGEAGAITTNDSEVARQCRMLRDHGQAKKYYHDLEGYNGRLDAIQAGILSIKLRHLSQWNKQRREIAQRYDRLFVDTEDIVTPFVPSYSRTTYHLYVIRIADRAGLQEYLTKKGIGTGIHYPVPLHLQKAYDHLGYVRGDFPACEHAAAEIVSLPMFPTLTAEQQKHVVATVQQFVRHTEGRQVPAFSGEGTW